VCDTELTEVEERTVLEDSSGLHLGAGPYLVFYARTGSDEGDDRAHVDWPADAKVRKFAVV
jgi:hypothetical protein